MANEIINEETKFQILKMQNFLREAFCIDGECDYIEDVVVKSTIETTHSAMFVLTDSQRGRFYVTLSKKTLWPR